MRVFSSSGYVSQLEPTDLANWPRPKPSDDKYSRPVVGIDTGSAKYPGAAVLSVIGALYSGASFIRFVGPHVVHDALLVRTPSVTIGPGKVQAWCVGSGWDEAEYSLSRFQARCADGVPMVIDAGALEFAKTQELPPNCLLTPHVGELARLLGRTRTQIESDPITSAQELASSCNATVLLKGATQYAVNPDGRVFVAVPGPAWTAQAGSGDVLAGVASVGLAAGLDALSAGALAASIQAMAAKDNPGPIPPDVLATHFGQIIVEHGEVE